MSITHNDQSIMSLRQSFGSQCLIPLDKSTLFSRLSRPSSQMHSSSSSSVYSNQSDSDSSVDVEELKRTIDDIIANPDSKLESDNSEIVESSAEETCIPNTIELQSPSKEKVSFVAEKVASSDCTATTEETCSTIVDSISGSSSGNSFTTDCPSTSHPSSNTTVDEHTVGEDDKSIVSTMEQSDVDRRARFRLRYATNDAESAKAFANLNTLVTETNTVVKEDAVVNKDSNKRIRNIEEILLGSRDARKYKDLLEENAAQKREIQYLRRKQRQPSAKEDDGSSTRRVLVDKTTKQGTKRKAAPVEKKSKKRWVV